jgi:hypothetical protein
MLALSSWHTTCRGDLTFINFSLRIEGCLACYGIGLFRRFSVKMLMRSIGIRFGLVNGAVDMLRWPINCVKPERFGYGVNHIVGGPGWNDHAVICLYMIGNAVNPHLADTFFEPKKLIAIFVDFLTDILARLD